MKPFFLGALFATLLACLLSYAALTSGKLAPYGVVFRPDPCASCGPGTVCENRRCLPQKAEAPPQRKKPPRKVQPAGGTQTPQGAQGAPAEAPEPPEPQGPPPVVLKPADLRQVRAGDNLGGTEVIDLTTAKETEGKELSQEDIDRVFQRRQPEILACLDQSKGEAPLVGLKGKLVVSFRIQRTGVVSGVAVEGPAYLMGRGLASCIRPLVSGMRFPPSNGGQVVSYPFALR